jgi:hypothetical protein
VIISNPGIPAIIEVWKAKGRENKSKKLTVQSDFLVHHNTTL